MAKDGLGKKRNRAGAHTHRRDQGWGDGKRKKGLMAMDHRVRWMQSRYAACALSPRSVWWENQVEALDDGRLSVCRWCVCVVCSAKSWFKAKR